MKVAIVGAGWAGLAAALHLRAQGIQVTVFEASKVPGGRARRVDDSRLGAIDNGQHIFLGAYRETLKLIQDTCGAVHLRAGFKRLPLWLKSADGQFEIRASTCLPANLQGMVALWRAKGLSAIDKLAITRLLLSLKTGHKRAIPNQSVHQWLLSQGQSPRAMHWLWRPLCIATMNSPPHEACALLFRTVLRDSLLNTAAGATDLLLPRMDLSKLWPEAAAASVDCQFGHTVRAVRPLEDHVMLDDQRFDACILATPPYSIMKLLGSALTDSPLLTQLKAFDYRAITTCYVKLDQSIRLPAPMLLLQDDASGLRPGQWVFDRQAISNQHGANPAQLAAQLAFVISDSSSDFYIDSFDLAKRLVQQLSWELGQDIPAKILHAKCIQEKRATFAAVPGLERPENVTTWPRLSVAGDWTNTGYPAVLEGAVRSGIQAATTLAAYLKGTALTKGNDR